MNSLISRRRALTQSGGTRIGFPKSGAALGSRIPSTMPFLSDCLAGWSIAFAWHGTLRRFSIIVSSRFGRSFPDRLANVFRDAAMALHPTLLDRARLFPCGARRFSPRRSGPEQPRFPQAPTTQSISTSRKLRCHGGTVNIPVAKAQIAYEVTHLRQKLNVTQSDCNW